MKNENFQKRMSIQFHANSGYSSTPVKNKIFSERHIPSIHSKKPSATVDWFFREEDQPTEDSPEKVPDFDKTSFRKLLDDDGTNSTNYFSYKDTCRQKNDENNFFSWKNSSLSEQNQKMIHKILIQPRKIPKIPYKTLEAPDLKDDFYFSLLDWSPFDNLAVALGKVVYIWNSKNSSVLRLCETEDIITSLACSPLENNVAVATENGKVSVFSIEESSEIYHFRPHKSRVGTMTWNGHVLACGSRDKQISMTDLRCCGRESSRSDLCFQRGPNLRGHCQEVCGLRFSPDGRFLASGGNDNRLNLWDIHSSSRKPAYTFLQHKAAVKALAWSPHKRGLLASGGGTADQEIRFWNSLTGQSLSHYKTESQICNMVWSKNTNELVTTYGYSMNEVVVWKYPVMTELARLSGHTARVLYVALSPDGSTVVTGSGDESLRFWNLFGATCSKGNRSVLELDNFVR